LHSFANRCLAALENLQVGAAGERGFDADADFAGLERGRCDFFDDDFFLPMEDGGISRIRRSFPRVLGGRPGVAANLLRVPGFIIRVPSIIFRFPGTIPGVLPIIERFPPAIPGTLQTIGGFPPVIEGVPPVIGGFLPTIPESPPAVPGTPPIIGGTPGTVGKPRFLIKTARKCQKPSLFRFLDVFNGQSILHGEAVARIRAEGTTGN